MNVVKLYVVKDYEEMSKKAGEIVKRFVKENPTGVLGLATGSTPEGMYQYLIDDHRKNGTSYKHMISFNLDEYVGLGEDHPQSYRYFMDHKLFNHIDIDKSNTHVPNGMAEDLEEECRAYDASISDAGGVDLQILGIGQNGHIAFNEPGTPFDIRTHVVELKESTRKANSRFFNSIDEVPTRALTVGIGTILESNKIILLASGKSKAEAMQKLLAGPVTEELPASALKNHPDVIIIADEDSLSATDEETIRKYLSD
jgi:glucosamine-6-phosphate isomerase